MLRSRKELSEVVKKPISLPKPIEGDREVKKQDKPLENKLNLGDSSPYNSPPLFPTMTPKARVGQEILQIS